MVEEEEVTKGAEEEAGVDPVCVTPSRRASAPEALGADSPMRVEEAEVPFSQTVVQWTHRFFIF